MSTSFPPFAWMDALRLWDSDTIIYRQSRRFRPSPRIVLMIPFRGQGVGDEGSGNGSAS